MRILHEHDLPEVRRKGSTRPRHARHVRLLELVLSQISGQQKRRYAVRSGNNQQNAPRRQIRRRTGTRVHAPFIRAFYHEGTSRYGLSQFRRAVQIAHPPRHYFRSGRNENEQVPRKRGFARFLYRHLRFGRFQNVSYVRFRLHRRRSVGR